MKNLWNRSAAIVVFAVSLVPAGAAHATCTTTLADPACKAEAACQTAIITAAATYTSTVQRIGAKFLKDSRAGAITSGPVLSCFGGPRARLSCGANNGVCAAVPGSSAGKFCSVDADCGGVAGSCDRTKGCNPALADNTYECAPRQSKTPYARDIARAQEAIFATMKRACVTPAIDPADLGLTNNAYCPAIADATTLSAAYDALGNCIKNSITVDPPGQVAVEANLWPFTVTVGTGAIAPKAQSGLDPRMVLELLGASTFEMGSGFGTSSVLPNLNPSGPVLALSLASCRYCSNSLQGCVVDGDCPISGMCTPTGNGNSACVNQSDCGTDAAGLAGSCRTLGNVGGERLLSGIQPVFNPSDPQSLGNTIAEQAQCTNSVALCLVTRAKNAGNGTTTSGSINLLNGHFTTSAPIVTDMYVSAIGVSCPTFNNSPEGSSVACPVCRGGVCSNDGNTTCTAPDETVTPECPPSGFTTIHIPNQVVLSTDPKVMLPAAMHGNVFCGFCTLDQTRGCQTDAECVAEGAGTSCDFSQSQAGFNGDPTVTVILAPGVSNQYAPLASALYCTGKTGNPVVDSSLGLPGPVRTVNPFLLGYVQTTHP